MDSRVEGVGREQETSRAQIAKSKGPMCQTSAFGLYLQGNED
jgi:hypothetical protein